MPCATSHPRSRNHLAISARSTPSATVVRFSACDKSMTARTIASATRAWFPGLSLVVGLEQYVGVEAAVVAGVTRAADLVHHQQHGIAVAVQPYRMHPLGVAGGGAFDPLFAAGPREIGALAGLQRARQRLVVHPRDHQHVAAAALLHDRGEQAVGVAFESRRDIGIERHRTVIPSAAMACFTCPMVSCRKWNTLAANTASAPATTAGAKWSAEPAPPLAITGTVTADRTARSIGRSNPARVPSASMELSRISPTPNSAPRAAHSTASIPVPRRPPWVVTSQPDGVGAEPSGTVRASTDNTMHCEPNWAAISANRSGRAIAAVLIDTLSAPARNNTSTSASRRERSARRPLQRRRRRRVPPDHRRRAGFRS